MRLATSITGISSPAAIAIAQPGVEAGSASSFNTYKGMLLTYRLLLTELQNSAAL